MAAVLALAVALVLADTTHASARPARSPFADLETVFFGKPRTRRARGPVRLAIPLPMPRPPDAPRLAAPVPIPAPNPAAAPKPDVAETLPKPRPSDAPPRPPEPSAAPAKPPVVAAPAPEPPPPSACRLALTDAIAVAPSIPDIAGPGECGGTDLVRLEAIVLPDGARVPLKPAATLRCEMATAVAAWLRGDIVPLTASLGSAPAALDNFDSFDCRGRNRVAGAKVSEHGHANALDVRGIALKNGVSIALTDRATPRETRETVLQSVCARFTTVLGPGSDGYHEDHIHLDLAARRSGYRICQWQIYDPMPEIAPLLPAPRPDEAPPRRVAAEKPDSKPAEASPNAEEVEPEVAPEPKPTRKRQRVQ